MTVFRFYWCVEHLNIYIDIVSSVCKSKLVTARLDTLQMVFFLKGKVDFKVTRREKRTYY